MKTDATGQSSASTYAQGGLSILRALGMGCEGQLAMAENFARMANRAASIDDLKDILATTSEAMGFRYFALTHHVDFRHSPDAGLRIHNYPEPWEAWFDEHKLGPIDPVHRASHVTSSGFLWSDVPRMIRMTASDQQIFRRAWGEGIGDGITIPAHIPGEAHGSCSFATQAGRSLCRGQFAAALLVGDIAFESARRLSQIRAVPPGPPLLTDRQRECVLWVARGKTDGEIAHILGISQDTVIEHLRHARERYGVQNRAMLAVVALFDGSICFSDVLRH